MGDPKDSNFISLYNNKDYERELNTVSFNSHPDPEQKTEKPFRSNFWRDYARILHSPAFRRLTGKTQLFPGSDSDFFRCRLTHSLEVSEVGKSIANWLNYKLEEKYKEEEFEYNKNSFIDTDLIELACLAHDIGHPPFGHQGEEALDELMRDTGGFEGNAQTLRILSVLEKKEFAEPPPEESSELDYTGFDKAGNDLRKGLNLCYRSLASVLKYDNEIGFKRDSQSRIEKGYYRTESKLVQKIKTNVAPGFSGKFKTVECQIMDIADDIAYSVFDIEDSFKGGFIDPLGYLTAIDSKESIQKIVERVRETGEKDSKDLMKNCTTQDVQTVIYKLLVGDDDKEPQEYSPSAIHMGFLSKLIAEVGYLRTGLSTDLVTHFIYKTKIAFNKDYPALSKVYLDEETEFEIEVLKRLTYQYQITSPKLKMVEHRGKSIVKGLFHILKEKNGSAYLPTDIRKIIEKLNNANKGDQTRRVICDFISGMTDKFAVEYYERLQSGNKTSIHLPIS